MFTTGAVNITLRIGGLQLERAGAHGLPAGGVPYDVTEAAVADRFGLAFDGVDDHLLTGTLDLTGTNKVTVGAGIAEAGLVNAAYVTNFKDTGFNAFNLYVPTATANAIAFIVSGNTAGIFPSETGLTAPLRAVLLGTGDLGAPSAILRRNGTQVGSSTSATGGGNFGSGILGIGRRANGADRYFNGLLHGLVVRGAASTAPEISGTENTSGRASGDHAMRLTIICPAAHIADANNLAQVLGYGPADGLYLWRAGLAGRGRQPICRGQLGRIGCICHGGNQSAGAPGVDTGKSISMAAAGRAQALVSLRTPGEGETRHRHRRAPSRRWHIPIRWRHWTRRGWRVETEE